MDHLQEQIGELEALESIYPTEIVVNKRTTPISFTVTIRTDELTDIDPDPKAPKDEIISIEAELKFTLPKDYPEELPTIEIFLEDDDEADEQMDYSVNMPKQKSGPKEHASLSREDRDKLIDHLMTDAKENLMGMVMSFSLVSSATEWLNQHLEALVTAARESRERKKREEDEAERKRFEGTRVTMETFTKWRQEFDAEMALIDPQIAKSLSNNKKLTGRELFERDKNLFDSDLKLLEDGDLDLDLDKLSISAKDKVEIDEALFDDDDEDDEYDPLAEMSDSE